MCVTVSEFEPRSGNFKKCLRLFLLVVAMETNYYESHRTMNIKNFVNRFEEDDSLSLPNTSMMLCALPIPDIDTMLNHDHLLQSIINPRCACAARVTVLGPSVCLSVCQSVCPRLFSHCRQRRGIRAIPTAPAQQAIQN